MIIKGWDLEYFNSGEWQVCDERLKDLERINRPIGQEGYTPGRATLFSALRATPFEKCKVAFVGQDPYPDRTMGTGLAFSVPGTVGANSWPPTLKSILNEYSADLKRQVPRGGSLAAWADQGVLLWNTIPSTEDGKSLSHDWPEWAGLTREIFTKLSKKGIVFALLGQVARRHIDCINTANNHIICTSHPSPRGSHKSHNPFVGSRVFSTINDKLNDLALSPVDWTLD